jgi:DNA (cytosine-5)-methyltransferase 1
MKYTPTAKSYFSGAGGMDLGILRSGINIIESFEIDDQCCKTLENNFSHRINKCDVSKVTVLDQEDADIYIATFPCTKYSTAADIHNARTGDDLFLHFFRHIALAQPELYIVENVPGMLKFQIVMEALTKLPNYYINIKCPVDANIWLPQKRPRLILIGSKKPFNITEPEKDKPLKLKDILEKEPEIKIPQYVYNRLKGIGNYRDKPIISDPNKDNIAPTAVAHYSKDVSTRLVYDIHFPENVRPYTPKEYARLQGFPDDFHFSGSDREMYKQVGNAVPVPLAEWIGAEVLKYFN